MDGDICLWVYIEWSKPKASGAKLTLQDNQTSL